VLRARPDEEGRPTGGVPQGHGLDSADPGEALD